MIGFLSLFNLAIVAFVGFVIGCIVGFRRGCHDTMVYMLEDRLPGEEKPESRGFASKPLNFCPVLGQMQGL
jgi:hypothetical protein